MTPQAEIAMLIWLPLVLCIFKFVSPQKAVVIGFIGAWLFLPQRAGFIFPGIPNYTRASATSYSVLLATCLFDFQRFRTFKFGWLDIPMFIWCVCPFISSMTNGLGPYDGVSAVVARIIEFGTPYFLGRIYLNSLVGLRHLAVGIFISGLIYAPLCLYESVMSPQLHNMVYGYHGIRQFAQSYRLGGYRPNVFMIHGLSVGMWMMAATLIGIWLWQSGVLKQVWIIPMSVLIPGMVFTHILVRSTGAYLYMIYGLVVLFTAKSIRSSLPLLVLIIALSSYLYMGVSGTLTGGTSEQILETMSTIVEEDRVASLEFRFRHEEPLVEKAKERMIFGWGGWGRNRIFEYNWAGELVDVSVTDSLWIIAYGVNGIVGIIGIFGSTLLPAFSFFWLRYPASTWFNPKVAPAAAIATVIVLYVLDNCLNNQYNPVFALSSGALAGLILNPNEVSKVFHSAKSSRRQTSARTRQLRPSQKQLN